MARRSKRQPKTTVASSQIDRQPKARLLNPSNNGSRTPLFSFRYADHAGAAPCGFSPEADDAMELLSFLCEMSRLTWKEVRAQVAGGHKRHHVQPVDGIAQVAQDHLVARKLDETIGENIFRFRLTGMKRLWGFVADDVFHALWWDPEHEVYPTEKS